MVKRIKKAYSNIVDSQVADGENPVAKVPLYINGDTNGNLILEPLIEDIGEEVDDNETAEKRLERLQKRYKESNLRDCSIKQRNHDEEIARLGSVMLLIDRRVSTNEGNNKQQHEVVLQRFDRTDGLLQQLVKTPY